MSSVYLILIFCLFYTRMFAGYDSRYQNGKYFKIKNKIMQKILLDKYSYLVSKNRLKKDMNKI